MSAVLESLARLRFEDPRAADAVVDVLWETLSREDPRLFHALWRRANRNGPRRLASVAEPEIEWLADLPPLVAAEPLPSVNLLPYRPRPVWTLTDVHPTVPELLPA